MKKRVVVVDDTLWTNAIQVITPQMRLDHLKVRNRSLPAGARFLLVKDRQGRQVQRAANVGHVYEGKRLERAVRRAERWMRSDKFPKTGAPHQIALAMAAFHLADPDRFKEVAKCNS